MQGIIRTSCLALAIVIFAVLFSGCTTLGPDFKTPEAPQADQWLEAETPQLRAELTDLTDWWHVFNDPVLDQLIEVALNQNLLLQIAGLRILEARAQLGIATGAQYPQFQQAAGSASKIKISENSPNFNPLLEDDFRRYEVGFDAAWELDFWGRFRRGVEAADANLAASVADYHDAMVSLTAEVARAYISIRTFEERIRLAENNVRLQQRSLKIADVRFRNGATTELDVQQARANLADTRALIPVLLRGLRQAKNGLSTLLGMPPGQVNTLLVGPTAIPGVPPEVAIGIPAELLRRRPDVRRAEFVAALESARIGIARADLYPSFSLFGSIGFETGSTGNSNASDLFDSDSLTSSIGPAFNWNIFNYGRLKNNVRAQDARFQRAAVNYQDTVLRAYQETEDALVGFLQSQNEAGYRATGAAAAQRSAKLANIQYREGAVDFQRVVDSERFLVVQQDQLTTARGDIALNLIATFKALGGGWEVSAPPELVPAAMQKTMRDRTDWGGLLLPEDLPDGVQPPPPAREQPLFPKPDW